MFTFINKLINLNTKKKKYTFFVEKKLYLFIYVLFILFKFQIVYEV